jgi:hypothetical protein
MYPEFDCLVPGPELQPPALRAVGRLQEPAQAALPTPRPQFHHQAGAVGQYTIHRINSKQNSNREM